MKALIIITGLIFLFPNTSINTSSKIVLKNEVSQIDSILLLQIKIERMRRPAKFYNKTYVA